MLLPVGANTLTMGRMDPFTLIVLTMLAPSYASAWPLWTFAAYAAALQRLHTRL